MSNSNTQRSNKTPRISDFVADSIRVDARLGAMSGFLLVVLGVLAVATPLLSGIAVSSLLGALMIAAGMTTVFFCFKAGSFGSGFGEFLLGGITMFAGGVILGMPGESLVALTAVLIAYFIIDGIYTSYVAFKRRSSEDTKKGWGWVLASGLSSIALGGLIAYQWPESTNYALGLVVGIRLIFTGWTVAMLGMAGDQIGEDFGAVAGEIGDAIEDELQREAIREEVREELKGQQGKDPHGGATPQPA